MANRLLNSIPESYFKTAMSSELEPGPLPLINLAVGIPDGRTPEPILEAVTESVYKEENQRYVSFRGKPSFKHEIKTFYKKHYDVDLEDDNIALLYGTKSALVQFPMIFIEPGEGVFLPNPGYPDYGPGVMLARGETYDLPLLPENGYLPDYDSLPDHELQNARLIYLNYPSNPLGAVADKAFFDRTVERFKETRTRIVHDFAYATFSFDNPHPSILESDTNLDCAIEIYSLSKGFNMSGFRTGFAVGNREMIEAINTYQDHTQTGMWGVTQDASAAGLRNEGEILSGQKEKFRRRSAMVTDAFTDMGVPINPIKGGIFGWIKVPSGYDGESFRDYLIQELSILVTPGFPFGSRGKDYIRISLAVEDAVLRETVSRFQQIKHLWQ
ncbi:aminotransferase class I/II-fold pyridoxal phosphate-dependent enzyme [Salinicoccus cyprini]|uniref:Aminotransferase class I/II-fold pyridoxal phosphate-dependent enzyme n=1 Tax=Salinicoccus cyprini TaxID=2493691 RepID=A0A558AYH8_9STAP|nr:aminotransferase class I/II-fold pyridoxal phosphate-dependent enzyme [Salinicoccus cyprini]TVT29313.1 aminotransferase class I/II-fold pyridoxal phosphate-dependent enzyme [Salinicoccus cyprini]